SVGRRSPEAFITFKYTVDGKEFTRGRYRAVPLGSWTDEGARRIADRYRVGQTYLAWYDPADPNLAVLNRDSEWWFGGMFVLAGVPAPTLSYLIFVQLGPKWASAGSHRRPRRRRRPFASTPQDDDQAIRIPAAGATLAADIDCIRCGYVLRGL